MAKSTRPRSTGKVTAKKTATAKPTQTDKLAKPAATKAGPKPSVAVEALAAKRNDAKAARDAVLENLKKTASSASAACRRWAGSRGITCG